MGTAVTANDQADHRRRLHETLTEAGVVMLLSRGPDGALHGRPMAVAHVDADDTMYFATSIRSSKIQEVSQDPRVDLVFQSKTRFATINGVARISQDRELIHRLWAESWKVWFPDGQDDPDIALVIVEPDRGEYWDQSGIKGLSYAFRAVKAYVTGQTPEPQPELHGVVKNV